MSDHPRQWRIPAYGGPLDGQTITVTGPGPNPPHDLRALNRATLRDMWRDFDATEPVAAEPLPTTLYLLHTLVCHRSPCHGGPCQHVNPYEYRTSDQTPPRKATPVITPPPSAPVATLTIPEMGANTPAARFALVPTDEYNDMHSARATRPSRQARISYLEVKLREAQRESATVARERDEARAALQATQTSPLPYSLDAMAAMALARTRPLPTFPSLPRYSAPAPLPDAPDRDLIARAADRDRAQSALRRTRDDLLAARADLADSRARHKRATEHIGRRTRDLAAVVSDRDAFAERLTTERRTHRDILQAATENQAQVRIQRLSGVYNGLMGGYVTVKMGGHSVTGRIQSESSSMEIGGRHSNIEAAGNVTVV